MSSRLMSFILVAFVLWQCSSEDSDPNASQPNPEQKQDSGDSRIVDQAEATAEESQTDEADELSADKPQIITGAYLTCSEPTPEEKAQGTEAITCGFFNDGDEFGLPYDSETYDYQFTVLSLQGEVIDPDDSFFDEDGFFVIDFSFIESQNIKEVRVLVSSQPGNDPEIRIEYVFSWADEEKKEKLNNKKKEKKEKKEKKKIKNPKSNKKKPAKANNKAKQVKKSKKNK